MNKQDETFTMAWKVYTPSISELSPSVYCDWSNEQDGVRIMELFCADITGHPSYVIVRITRNSKNECEKEFRGQLTDGYFESYKGDIVKKEVKSCTTKAYHNKLYKMTNKLNEVISKALAYELGKKLRDDSEVEIDVVTDAETEEKCGIWLCDYSESRGGAEFVEKLCNTNEISVTLLRSECWNHKWCYVA